MVKVLVIKDLFGIGVIVSVNVINHVILESISTMKTVSVEKKLVDKLVEEYTETVEEMKLAKITSAEHENVCKSSSTIYVVLFLLIFTASIGISTYFVYCK